MDDEIDIRALGAVRFFDVTTGVWIKRSLEVTAPGVRFARNGSGAYVMSAVRGLEDHVDAFGTPPSTPPLGTITVTASVDDPAKRYLPRVARLQVPRDPNPANATVAGSLFRPTLVPLYPSPMASLEPGWAVVRVSVKRTNGSGLPNAYLRVRRASQPTTADPPLARGLADGRGEGLIPVQGIAVTNWDADDRGPVISSEIDAVLEAYFDQNAGSPPDPDLIDSRRLLVPPNPNALPQISVNLKLASGKERAVTVVIPV